MTGQPKYRSLLVMTNPTPQCHAVSLQDFPIETVYKTVMTFLIGAL